MFSQKNLKNTSDYSIKKIKKSKKNINYFIVLLYKGKKIFKSNKNQ